MQLFLCKVLKNSKIGYYRLCIFILSLVINPVICKAQNSPVYFHHFNVNSGMAHYNVEYIHVQDDGNIWIGTANGLQRFDGYTFTTYNYNPDDSLSISGNFINTIFEDTEGNILIGTIERGLNIFDPVKETFYRFKQGNDSATSIIGNIPRTLRAMVFDKEGFLWLNSDKGLNKINLKNKTVEKFLGDFAGQISYDENNNTLWIFGKKLKKYDIKTNTLQHIDFQLKHNYETEFTNSGLIDKQGVIWITTIEGIFAYDKHSKRILSLNEFIHSNYKTNHNIDYSWSFKPTNAVFEDFQGNIWFAIEKSIYMLNRADGSYRQLVHETDNLNSLLDERISGIYGNESGIIWITYLNIGMSKININTKKFKVYQRIPGVGNSLSGKTVRSIFKDDKNLWIGTYTDGLNRISNGDNKITHFIHNPEDAATINSNYVAALYVDSRERLWVGSFEDGFCYADNINQPVLAFKKFKLEGRVETHEFFEDKAGRIWIATQKGFYMWSAKKNKLNHYGSLVNQLPELTEINIQSMLFEPPNIFWLATWNRGVCKLVINSDSLLSPAISKDSLVIYDKIKDIDNSNIDNRFITIFEDRTGNIWLGSNVSGLIKMNLHNGTPSFLKYDKTKGAPDNSIFGIADDKSGNIWVSTNRGIGKFDPKTEKFKNYHESDGLQSNSFIWDASFQSKDGEIFFGGSMGLNSFYPESIIDNSKLPVVYISKLIVNNKVVNVRDKFDNRIILEENIRYTSEITLTSNESVFSLEFIAMDYISQDEVLYAYQLEGFDKDWVYVNADKRTVNYTNLDDGTYFFKVKASNSDRVWNEKPVILKITILPPWWKTIWAYLLYLLIFAFLLFFFRRLALIRAKLKNELVIEHINRVKDEELHQSKLKFFTNISHEFRTPLTLILGPLERIMATGQGDNLMKRQFLMIKRNADRLNLLIDQLMDFRKIDNGLMTLDAVEGDICKFICDISLLFEGSAIEKNISLSIKCSGNNFNVWFDRDKMEKIIYNLLSNAFKFTPDNGSIVINVSFISVDQVSRNSAINPNKSVEGIIIQYVEISVEDSGIGIPASNIEHVFERFYKGGNSEIIAQKGTGIGLALTKDFVELHGGEIFVKSDEGKGSCFTFWLPKGDSINRKIQYTIPDSLQLNTETIIWDGLNTLKHNDFETGSESAPSQIKGKAPLILVVDDDSEIVKFIGESLNTKYKIIDAENGLLGLQSAVDNNPDLIISDVMMPEMDGIELCQKLKTNLKVSHIPVILLTAKTALESRIEGIETGADAYLSKPFSIKLLEAQITNLLASRKKLREDFGKKITVEPSEITITSTDEKFIKKAIMLVEEHIDDPEFSVEQLGRELGLSRSHLHRKLIAITSQPATEFIRTIRLKRSAQLLVKSKLTVEEITYKVGFNSPSYFTKCFRLHFGMTPSEYIENSQKS